MDGAEHAAVGQTVTLNDEQRAVVEHGMDGGGGPMVVLAGPGTGKTRVIVHRVAHLIRERGADPSRVMVVTFTNKAATELRDRLRGVLGFDEAEAVNAGTFHSIGLAMISRFGDELGLPPASRIRFMDSAQRKRLCRSIVEDEGLFARAHASGIDAAIESAMNAIGAMRNRAISAEQAAAILEKHTPEDEAEAAEIARFRDVLALDRAFVARSRSAGLLTFDDLITLPTELLNAGGHASAICRGEVGHVIVDEFQDTNAAQIEMLRALAPPGGETRDVVAVGDDDQAIYAFRGASPDAFGEFAKTWGPVTTRTLTLNYRSSRHVVAVSNAIIARANERFEASKVGRAVENAEDGAAELVRLRHFTEDGWVIAREIKRAHAEHGLDWSSFAVLTRTRLDLSRIAPMLELSGIPVDLEPVGAAYDDPAVQDLLAWIRLLVDPEDTPSAMRLMTRAPAAVPVERVQLWYRHYRAERSHAKAGGEEADETPFLEWVFEKYTGDGAFGVGLALLQGRVRTLRDAVTRYRADEVVGMIVREAGLLHADTPGPDAQPRRLRNLAAAMAFVERRVSRVEAPGDLAAFWRYYEDLDEREQKFDVEDPSEAIDGPSEEAEPAGGVRLLTAHGSKGLEFHTVFIPRLGQHGFPNSRKNEPVLPTALDASERTRAQFDDEERRLIYVAATRAVSRVVFMGKLAKKPTSTSYAHELIEDGGGVLAVHEVEDLLGDEAAIAGMHAELTGTGTNARPRALARLRIGAILDQVEAGATSPEKASETIRAETKLLAELSADDAEHAPVRPEHAWGPLHAPLSLSYSSINAYRTCPRCYYLSAVLRLGEGEDAPQLVGQAVHDALEWFYKAWRDADAGEGRPRPTRDDLIAHGVDSLRARAGASRVIDADWVNKVRGQLESAFDRLHDDGVNVLEVERKVSLPYEHEGVTHRLTAKLDRVDQLSGGRYRIVDYKTGRATQGLTSPKKDDLQLGIYTLALRHEFSEDDTGEAEYWALATGERGTISLDDLRMDKIKTVIDEAIAGMLGGIWKRGPKCYGHCAWLDDAGSTEALSVAEETPIEDADDGIDAWEAGL